MQYTHTYIQRERDRERGREREGEKKIEQERGGVRNNFAPRQTTLIDTAQAL